MLWRYRREMGLSWTDLTGEWPQPVWRTDQDLWYASIQGELMQERTRSEAKFASIQA